MTLLSTTMRWAHCFDADGNGAVAAVQIATIGAGLAMTNADIVVIQKKYWKGINLMTEKIRIRLILSNHDLHLI